MAIKLCWQDAVPNAKQHRRKRMNVARARLVTTSLILAVVSGCTCNRTPSVRITRIEHADMLWGGGAFCARTPSGLMCWSDSETVAATQGPTIVQGLTGVKEVALRTGEGCALCDTGVSCFRPGYAHATPRQFDAPTQIVVTDKHPDRICVLDSKGVSCWGWEMPTPQLQPELGRPHRLAVSVDGGFICGVYEDSSRCFEVDDKGKIGAALTLEGVKDLKSVLVSPIKGEVWVIDAAILTFSEFAGTLVVRETASDGEPPDAEVSRRPFTGATVHPQPVAGIGQAKVLALMSANEVVLDDHGVWLLFHQRGGDHANVRWPTDAAPSNLWSGYLGIFTREDYFLHQRGRAHGANIDLVVDDVTKPVRVVSDAYFTCILEDSGRVACVRQRMP